MSDEGIDLGRKGEDLALDFLVKSGYKIISRNYKTKLGEIDIIAKENNAICFIEVKTRSSKRFGLGCDTVSSRKQRQSAKAALIFLKENNLLDKSARFDVVSIDASSNTPEINLIKNAFELSGGFTY
jgi:putative endonuclease